ncbi:MAG: polyprenyl synthetase family protein [Ruminococcaceae bacterium]|nr:polyprenyl synthetase family protein [Oscillospiraceae bacterium]
MNFSEQLKDKITHIEGILSEYLPPEEGKQKTVIEAMNYSITAGGKRLRPMLMEETFTMFGGEGDVIKPFMAAIEMIHTYSLVHDDLPALDNDEYRRGKKTTHAVFGEAMGILAGDALLNYAFEVASTAFDIELSPKVAKALQVLSSKSGIYGMIGGQIADIESEGKKVGIDTIEFIHRLKCGALIESSMLIGAILAGASEQEQTLIEQIGADVGYAFQIQDDILDMTSSTEVLGKPVGSDSKNEKSTYVSLKGLEQAKADVAEISARAIDTLDSLPYENPFLKDLINMLINREK